MLSLATKQTLIWKPIKRNKTGKYSLICCFQEHNWNIIFEKKGGKSYEFDWKKKNA